FALTKIRRGGFSSQNDVKFLRTHAGKVSVKPFQRLAQSRARSPRRSPQRAKLPDKSKFERLHP
ncbi:MAG: hypothetical protein J6B12_05740, partial [Clostridia bacterium]|nr:hypothetical protein [Clostridia bacterium]